MQSCVRVLQTTLWPLSLALFLGLHLPAAAQLATPSPTGTPACCGDLNGDGVVSAAEAQACVPSSIPENPPPPAACDCNHDGVVSAGELTLIGLYAANGCPGAPTFTPTPPTLTPLSTATPTATQPCAPTGTPYCSDHCSPEPCATIREGCYAFTCSPCIQNPSCASDEACVPGFSQCCTCATFTPTGTATPTGTLPTATATPTATASARVCCGDCNGDGIATLEELRSCLENPFGPGSCSACDCNHDGIVTTDEVVTVVNNILNGCFGTPTATPTPTVAVCPGDCNGDGVVTVDEILTGIGMLLNGGTQCPAFDCCIGEICVTDVACIVGAINYALNGCPP